MAGDKTNIYLFSIDVEDVRFMIPNGSTLEAKVPQMTEQYLQFLRNRKMKVTFFVVGDVAREYPSLIQSILHDGHEVGCHGNRHIPLTQQDRAGFREDLKENLEHLRAAGATKVVGYRAPVFSLTEKTKWVYEVLAELGFRYSSSVLPAKNPLFGWAGFGREIKLFGGVWEFPVSLMSLKSFSIPFAGGVYFRILPYFILKRIFEKYFAQKRPIIGYFHPYDIDAMQERFMYPGINESKYYNYLMYYNRKSVFPKLEKLLDLGAQLIPYIDFTQQLQKEVR